VKRFVDSADPGEIQACVAEAAAGGVTIGEAPQQPALLRDICGLTAGPVVVDATAADRDGMLRRARALAAAANNVVVRLPATPAGIDVVRACRAEGITTAVAAGATPPEALAAVQAGVVYVSTLIVRPDGANGSELIRQIVALLKTYDVTADVLAGAIRSPSDIVDAGLAGARAVSVPPAVLRRL
jgi:transaldolase